MRGAGARSHRPRVTRSENPQCFPVRRGWNVGPGGLPPMTPEACPRGAAAGSVDHLPGPPLPPRGNTGAELNLCLYSRPPPLNPQPQPCCSHDLCLALSQDLGRASSCPPACSAQGPAHAGRPRTAQPGTRLCWGGADARCVPTAARLTPRLRVGGTPGTGGAGVPSSPFLGLSQPPSVCRALSLCRWSQGTDRPDTPSREGAGGMSSDSGLSRS